MSGKQAFLLTLVRRAQTAWLVAAALAGDASATLTIDAIIAWLACWRLDRSARDCLACGAVLRQTPPVMVVLVPALAASGTAVAAGVCRQCSRRTGDALFALALTAMTEFYDLHAVDPARLPPMGGNA